MPPPTNPTEINHVLVSAEDEKDQKEIMSEKTEIARCDSTFNPWIGCTKIDAGCKHCYAETLMDSRYHRVQWGKGNPRKLTSDANWKLPERWNLKPWICDQCGRAAICDKTGQRTTGMCPCSGSVTFHRARVFCASLADVFDGEVELPWLNRLWILIQKCSNLDWLVLTKRPENVIPKLKKIADHWGIAWVDSMFFKNVWIGTSVSDQESADKRIPELLKIPAAKRFISYEPSLGPVDFGLTKLLPREFQGKTNGGISWIIVGGESGASARPFNVEWARATIEQCRAAGVACFVKQMGSSPISERYPKCEREFDNFGRIESLTLKDKKGGDMSEWPEDLRVREWPK